MALLVSGVMSDYKETERFPCDLEALFTSLLALTRHGARLRRFDAAPALAALHAMLLTTAQFLDASATYGQVCAALAAHEEVLLWELDTRGAAGAATAHLAGLRGKIARAHIVRRTSFLLTAYTLTDSLVIIVVTLLVLTHQTSAVTGYVNTFIFSYLFFDLGALVRDIDDPLGYGGNHNERCLLAEALAADGPASVSAPAPAPAPAAAALLRSGGLLRLLVLVLTAAREGEAALERGGAGAETGEAGEGAAPFARHLRVLRTAVRALHGGVLRLAAASAASGAAALPGHLDELAGRLAALLPPA